MIKFIRKAKMKKYFFILFFFISYNICCVAQKGEVITPKISIPDSLVFGKSGFLAIEFQITRDGKIGKAFVSLIQLYKNHKYDIVYFERFPKYNKKIGLSLEKQLKNWINVFVNNTRFEKERNFDEEIKKIEDKFLRFTVQLEFGSFGKKRKMDAVK